MKEDKEEAKEKQEVDDPDLLTSYNQYQIPNTFSSSLVSHPSSCW